MAFRDEKWYMNAIAQAQKEVDARKAELDKLVASAELSLAAMKCDDLKAALLTQNHLENRLADSD